MRPLIVASYWLLFVLQMHTVRAEETPAAILERTRTVYTALTSYSDTGTTLKEYGPASHDESHFSTYFVRVPRHFFFDYHKSGGDRIVTWGDPDAFHVWWKATGQVTEFSNPNNSNAITLNDYPTGGAITKVPSLLYSKGNLPGALQHFEPERLAGTDALAGQKCYRIEGNTSDWYGGTGKQVNVRKMTLWVDTTTYLVRQILEEAPAAQGSLNRTTTTFDPRANPRLNDDSFKFAPPN